VILFFEFGIDSGFVGLRDSECLFDEVRHFIFLDEAVFVFVKLFKKLMEIVFLVILRPLRDHILLELPEEFKAFLFVQHSVLIIVKLLPQIINVDLYMLVIVA